MTKLESAERIIRQNGDCTGICCDKCLLDNYCDVRTKDEDKLEQAKKYKEEHEMKFKVGDKVKGNGSEDTDCMDEERKGILRSKEEHIISHIDDNDNTCLLADSLFWFKLEWFEKVESKTELIKGKRYEVSINEDFSNSRERIFDNYDEGFQEPYRCIDCMFEDEYENKFCIETDTWKYLREIQPKYKPYT